MSNPDTDACVPHFGGNGLPGYPAFIAAIWSLVGPSKPAVLWSQATIAALAVPRLAYAVGQLTQSRFAALAAGMVVALSPWEVLWVRTGLSETLSIGAVTWLLAELVLSVHQRRLRTGWVAVAFTAGLFLRLDFIVYLPAVALTALYVHGIRQGILRCAVLACLIAMPLAAWTARNLAVGLRELLPPASGWMLPNGSTGPLGYLAWVASWATTEEQRANAMFFLRYRYERIKIDPTAYRGPEQEREIGALLQDLHGISGQPFPARIDAAFAGLAEENLAAIGFAGRLRLHLAQAWGLWANWALPVPPEYLQARSANAMAAVAKVTHSHARLMQTFMWTYRFVLGVGFLSLALLALATRQAREEVFFVCLALAVVAAKTALAVKGLFLETRYTVTATPALELAVCLVAFGFWKRYRRGAGAAADVHHTGPDHRPEPASS